MPLCMVTNTGAGIEKGRKNSIEIFAGARPMGLTGGLLDRAAFTRVSKAPRYLYGYYKCI